MYYYTRYEDDSDQLCCLTFELVNIFGWQCQAHTWIQENWCTHGTRLEDHADQNYENESVKLAIRQTNNMHIKLQLYCLNV